MKKWCILLLCFCLPLWAQSQRKELEFTHETFRLQGSETVYSDVTIRWPGVFLLTADEAIYNEKDQSITARGNVKIDYTTSQGLVEVTAHEAVYYQASKSGMFTGVTAQFDEEVYFVGASLEILEGGERFIIEDGEVTACNQALPQWSMRIRKATIEKEGYAFIRGARFRVKNITMLYLPYFIAPAMQKRRSGLLTPHSGRTERNGVFYSQPFYWAPRQDMDFTLTPTYYKDAGVRLDVEARYVPTQTTFGLLDGSYFADDVLKSLIDEGKAPTEDGKALKENRFRLDWTHQQPALGGTLHLDIEAGSDFSVDRDYLQEAQLTRIRDYHYRLAWDRPMGRNLFSLNLNRLERVLRSNEEVETVSRLPDLRFYQPNTAIGGGFYARNYISATLFDVEDLGLEPMPGEMLEAMTETSTPLSDRVLRIGLESEISRAQNWVSFLHTRWGARYQGAFYRLEDREFDEESTRGGAYAFLETVGPRIQRIYHEGDRRLVHYLDAGITLKLGAEEEDPFLESIRFDELDIRIDELSDGVQATWRVNSRLFKGNVGNVRPLMEVEITQDARFESGPSDPIETRFRLLDLGGFNGHGLLEYNPDKGTLDTQSVYSGVNRGSWQGYGGYVRRRPDSESFIGISQWKLNRWRSRFKVSLDYDIRKNELKSQEFLYGYQGQCVGMTVNYVKSPFDSSSASGRDFLQFTVSLRNLSELGTRF